MEICYNNVYGSICDDFWDILDASVVCRQLGFNISEGDKTSVNYNASHLLLTQSLSVGSVALGGAYFGSGSGATFLDNVVCRGTESSLLECNTNPIGQHNCNHSEDAGVRCEGTYTSLTIAKNQFKCFIHFIIFFTITIFS